MTRALASVALVLALSLPGFARADMAEALALYDAGRHDEAFQAFVALAADGDGEAMLYIARMYEAGEGIHQSRPTALTWYRRAAAHDIAEAFIRLGEMFESGIGLPRNYGEAVRSYRAAADLGNTDAMVRLAALYENGAGAMPDPSEAARLLKQAADLGNVEAAGDLEALVASGIVPGAVLDELGVPPPPPPSLPTIEELAASELGVEAGAGDNGATPDPSSAAAVPEGGSDLAAQLRSSVAAAFDRIEGAEYTLDVSERADGVVAVVLRGFALVSPQGRWEVGDLQLRFAPRGDGSYDATVQLPEDTVFYDLDGNTSGSVTLGRHEVSGVYLPELDLWTAMQWDLHDLAITGMPGATDDFGLVADRLTFESAQEEGAEGKWSGPAAMVVEGLSFRDADGQESGHVDRIEVAGRQDRVDMVFLQAFNVASAEIEQFAFGPDRAGSETDTALREILLPLGALARERAPLIGAMTLNMTIDGIAGQDAATGTPVAIDRVSLAISGENLDRPKGDLVIAYEHSGLVMTVDGADQRYLPGEVSIRLALRDVPVEEAATMALETMESSLADPAANEDTLAMAAGFFALGLQQSMAIAGSRFDIEQASWRSPALSAEMTGSLVASTEAAQGAVGAVTLTVEGLDAAVTELAARGDDPDAQDMAMPLSMLQAMGQRSEEGGVTRHVYALELTPDGRTLLNGNDMGPMLDGLATEGFAAP